MLEIQGKYNKNCKIFAEEVEPEAYTLIRKILDERATADVPVRIMPDVHMGAGIVIGFTMPLTDMVNPEHIGVDIGCGIAAVRVEGMDKHALPDADKRIKAAVPTGAEQQKRFAAGDEWNLTEINRSVAELAASLDTKFAAVDDKYIAGLIKRIGIDERTFYNSLGTLGGGNHFIEMGVDDEGRYWITVHSGSRNFGLKVAKYHVHQARQQKTDSSEYARELDDLKMNTEDRAKIPELIKALREKHSKGIPKEYLRADAMKAYLLDMVVAQCYARMNRSTMLNLICRALDLKPVETVESVHNYISPRDLIIRKGAISAYEGERCIIPFNMRDGLLICTGKGNADWNMSAPHGAGRIMSRSKARATVSMSDYIKSMKGIYSSSISNGTLDEAPQAYKDHALIESLITPTVDVNLRVKPVLNIKAEE